MAKQDKVNKANKALAEMILRVQGKDYAEWLDQQHLDVITKNTQVIQQVTASMLVSPSSNHDDEKINRNNSEGAVNE